MTFKPMGRSQTPLLRYGAAEREPEPAIHASSPSPANAAVIGMGVRGDQEHPKAIEIAGYTVSGPRRPLLSESAFRLY